MLLEMSVKLRRGHLDLTTQLSMSDASVGLFGKSGAGKSTVLGLIAGTIQPQSGHIVLDGKILFDSRKGIVMPREQRPVGAVLQVDSTHSAETVRDNLTSAFNRTLKHRRIFKLDFLIGLLELDPILDHPIALLSAGEHQRRKPDRSSRLRWHAAGRNYAGRLPEHGFTGRRRHLLPDQNPFHYLPRRV